MKETFRLSIEVELRSAASDALAGHSNTDLDQLRKVLGAYARVIEDTVWPESEQGAFLEFVAQDVHEFSAAIRAEAEAGRWNIAIALLRPLQERSEYVLAAAVDQGFYERYRSRMGRQIETGLKDGSRLLAEDARGTIDRWVRRSKNTEGLLATGRGLNRVASELLHHGVGLSRVSAANDALRQGLASMAYGRVQAALAYVLWAIEIVGAADTAAWRAARQTL